LIDSELEREVTLLEDEIRKRGLCQKLQFCDSEKVMRLNPRDFELLFIENEIKQSAILSLIKRSLKSLTTQHPYAY